MNNNRMVIVGAGETGARAALELRELGWSGEIVLIGKEARAPYERPPLSKGHLHEEGEPVPVVVLDEETMKRLRIDFAAGDAAVRIDREACEVELASGRRLLYDKLLLATGAYPRTLSVADDVAARIRYLRTYEDASAIRRELAPGRKAVIIGGGFIGLEVAASAIAAGCAVSLVETAPRILMRGVPVEIARAVEDRHRAAGVAFYLNTPISEMTCEGDGLAVALADGTLLTCDTIIAGIGALPDTALAERSGLELDNGIKVNERLQTSDPAIFAAGDCCSFPHLLYGGRRMRLEAWRNAQDQGRHVAASMLGSEAPYSSVPWFWSDQYELTLQVAGLPEGGSETIVRDLGEAGKLYFQQGQDGRLAAASGIGPDGGIAKDIRIAEMLIAAGAQPSPEELIDPAVRLRKLLPRE